VQWLTLGTATAFHDTREGQTEIPTSQPSD